MPQTHGISRFFWHKIRLRTDAPRYQLTTTHEYEDPYRRSNSHTLRLFGHIGIVVGRWQGGGFDEESPEYEEHLQEAVQGYALVTNDHFQELAGAVTITPLGDR